MAIRFEKLTVKNLDTDEVIVSKSIDGPTGLKFCVEAPERVPAPERGPGLTRAPKLHWTIRVEKLEEPYEGKFWLIFDMIEPSVPKNIRVTAAVPSEFHISPYVMFRSFGPGEYEIYGYSRYPDYQGRVKYRMTVETGTRRTYEHAEEVKDGYVLTFNPDLFVSEHEGETVYFPKYYCEVLWLRERFPRISRLVNRVQTVR